MPIRSMTAYAQVKAQAGEQLAFTLSLKSVNHRFLDLHLRLPGDCDALDTKLRRALKTRIARGHVEVTLTFDRGSSGAMAVNSQLVGDYIRAFRAAAAEFSLAADPDLNAILRIPGALSGASTSVDGAFEAAVLQRLEEAITQLDQMRLEEGHGIERELRDRMERLRSAAEEVEKHRLGASRSYLRKIETRMKELLGNQASPERLLQEAALLAERSDIQEEIVRLLSHIAQFEALLDTSGEAGKKMDFLLQEMNREANTLLSKTSGVAGEGLRITELGLAMKSEIEKSREQVQNVE
jgi:uncharacterized protein (TIGR00255 family)